MLRSPEPDNQIVYINLQGQICVIDPGGSDHRLLTSVRRKRIFQFPAWSPDGSHIAAIGRTRGSAGVFVLPIAPSDNAADNAARALYVCNMQRPFYLYWSPNSHIISFLAAHPQGLGLHLVERSSGHHRLLTVGQPCYWDWTPSSKQVLIHTGGNGKSARLEYIDIQSADRDEEFARPGLFQAPGVAPSGQRCAFDEEDNDGDRHVVITQRTNATRTTVDHEGAVALGWCPTRDHLAFTSPTAPVSHFYGPLRLLNAETRQVYTLTDDTVLAFFWSPDGNHIAYLTLARQPQRQEPDGSRTNGSYTNGHSPHQNHPQQQPDPILHLWVVDTEHKQRRLLTTFQPSEEFIIQFMPFFDQYMLSHRIWSPASDALVVPAVINKRPHVLVVPRDGSPPAAIAEGSIAFWNQR